MAVEGKLRLTEETTLLVSRLVGRIVHDFNNPLAAIIGFADLLKNPNIKPEKQERYVNRIHEQAVKLGDMVENMATFTAVPAPELSVQDVRRLTADVHALRCGTMERSGTTLTLRCPDEPVMAMADRAIVSRILNSLLNNVEQTFKENPEGERRALLECGQSDKGPYIAVGDSGPGIDADISEQVFEPFFSTRKSGGLGLGLTVSNGLAGKLGGDLVLAQSTEHEYQGARLVLHLPPQDG